MTASDKADWPKRRKQEAIRSLCMLCCLYTHTPTQCFPLKSVKAHPPTHCAPFKIHFPVQICEDNSHSPILCISVEWHPLPVPWGFLQEVSFLSLSACVCFSLKKTYNPHKAKTKHSHKLGFMKAPENTFNTLYNLRRYVSDRVCITASWLQKSQVNSWITQEVQGLWY